MKIRKIKGMTLVELVAAMAILGIVLVSVSTLILTIAKYNNIMKCKVTNSAIAQKVIEYYKARDLSKLCSINKSYEQYVSFKDNPKDDLKDDSNFMNIMGGAQNGFQIKEVNSIKRDEKYGEVVKDLPSSVNPKDYDHIIKVVLIPPKNVNDDMISIDATVWDSKNTDQCKVEYVTLKGY